MLEERIGDEPERQQVGGGPLRPLVVGGRGEGRGGRGRGDFAIVVGHGGGDLRGGDCC